jgi:hypothetical protein
VKADSLPDIDNVTKVTHCPALCSRPSYPGGRGALNTPSPVDLSLFSITTVLNVHRATRHRLRLSQTRQPAALKPRVSVLMVHFIGLLTSVYSHSGWQYELFKTIQVR